MKPEIGQLADRYRAQRSHSESMNNAMRDLYGRFVRGRESTVLEAAAAATAIGVIISADHIDYSAISPQMEEAFHLAYPNHTLAQLESLDSQQLEGFLPAWKGKYFEVIVRDRLNEGEWVGDLHLEPGQAALLADSPIQPGWDLQLVDNVDGHTVVDQVLQLKATDSLRYVRNALEKYPDIQIVSTDEVGNSLDGLLNSGIQDSQLESQISDPMSDLLDGPVEDLLETVIPFLPFMIVAVSESRFVMLGRKTHAQAWQSALHRSVKSGAAMGVGALVWWMDGGVLSIPATFVTRFGIDRYTRFKSLNTIFVRRNLELTGLQPRYLLLVGSPQ